MNIARIFAQKQWLQGAQDGSETGSEEAFAETPNTFICLNANEGPIEIAFDDGGSETNDFQ
jgi:hypothetical protein